MARRTLEEPRAGASYPYLTLAQQRGLDYGLVLAWSDVVSSRLTSYPLMAAAQLQLSREDKNAIRDLTYKLEPQGEADKWLGRQFA